jgi:GT2 family glycosyltransferase
MKVDIVIPNYNGSHLIEKNLSAVIKSMEGYSGKIIIVDDGSAVEDKEKLRKFLKGKEGILFIEHDVNKGFSSAVNTGVKTATGDYVTLLNSDVSPSGHFLFSALQKLENDPNLFAVGCMDESIEGDKKVLRGRGIAVWKKGMLHHMRGEVDKADTFWVSGGSSVFRRSIYKQLGGMDEIFNPFYWEDIDLSYRAQKAGYKIIFDKRCVVKHMHDEGSIKTFFAKNTITSTAYRNQFIFIWKNITNYYFLLNHFIFLPVNCYGALRRGDKNFFNGLFLAVGQLPAIIVRRRKQKRFYKISDPEIINHIS